MSTDRQEPNIEPKYRILLVEDDPFLRSALGIELAEHGYIVSAFNTGLEALNNIDRLQVDAVLTDIFMPEMDGLELIPRLRKHYPNIPIFAMSGMDRHCKPEDYLRFAKRFGADEVFTKPIEMAKLISKLASHCQRRTPNTQ